MSNGEEMPDRDDQTSPNPSHNPSRHDDVLMPEWTADGHVDEGSMHAWLDDAFDASQAETIHLHVTGCAACQASVAEARGFIAGASRVTKMLDAVPAGVVSSEDVARSASRILSSASGGGGGGGGASTSGGANNARSAGSFRPPSGFGRNSFRIAATLLVFVGGAYVWSRTPVASVVNSVPVTNAPSPTDGQPGALRRESAALSQPSAPAISSAPKVSDKTPKVSDKSPAVSGKTPTVAKREQPGIAIDADARAIAASASGVSAMGDVAQTAAAKVSSAQVAPEQVSKALAAPPPSERVAQRLSGTVVKDSIPPIASPLPVGIHRSAEGAATQQSVPLYDTHCLAYQPGTGPFVGMPPKYVRLDVPSTPGTRPTIRQSTWQGTFTTSRVEQTRMVQDASGGFSGTVRDVSDGRLRTLHLSFTPEDDKWNGNVTITVNGDSTVFAVRYESVPLTMCKF